MGIYNFIVGVWGVMRKISQVGIVLIFILGAIYIFMPKTDKAEMLSSANTNQSEYTSLSRLRMDIVDKRLTEMSASPSGALVSGIIRGMNCKFAGMLCEDKTKGEMEHFGGSLMGLATKGLIVPFVQPPASGVYYAMDSLQKVGFIPKTYAAEGIGFSGLKVYLDIWKIFRDLAYMIFVIVLIFAGFAIMFQWKIGGKTAVTLENALVKIVFAMIIINFSYAIAGFMIDLMYVVMGIIVSFLGRGITVNGSPADSAYIAGLTNDYINAGPHMIFNSLFGDGQLNGQAKDWAVNGNFKISAAVFLTKFIGSDGDLLAIFVVPYRIAMSLISIIPDTLRWILSIVNIYISAKIAGVVGKPAAWIGDTTSMVAGATFSWGNLPKIAGPIGYIITFLLFWPIALPLILSIIIMITFFYFFVRIVFIVFFTYVQIILAIVTAPLMLMTEAIPGQNRFLNWLKGLVGQLSTFPILVGSFLLSRMIASRADLFKASFLAQKISPNEGLWTPPFMSDGYIGGYQLRTGLDSGAFLFLVGMSIMFMTPEFIKMAKKAIGGGGVPVKFSPLSFFAAGTAITALPNMYRNAMFYSGLLPNVARSGIDKVGSFFGDNNYLGKFGKSIQSGLKPFGKDALPKK